VGLCRTIRSAALAAAAAAGLTRATAATAGMAASRVAVAAVVVMVRQSDQELDSLLGLASVLEQSLVQRSAMGTERNMSLRPMEFYCALGKRRKLQRVKTLVTFS
jgi:hypothetical protein